VRVGRHPGKPGHGRGVGPEGRAELEKFKTYMDEGTVRGRLPTLRELADAAVFAASDRATAMTGAIVNLTCGSIMD
jgi:3-oxoacyl-[acyl-carrier protein] reductase